MCESFPITVVTLVRNFCTLEVSTIPPLCQWVFHPQLVFTCTKILPIPCNHCPVGRFYFEYDFPVLSIIGQTRSYCIAYIIGLYSSSERPRILMKRTSSYIHNVDEDFYWKMPCWYSNCCDIFYCKINFFEFIFRCLIQSIVATKKKRTKKHH